MKVDIKIGKIIIYQEGKPEEISYERFDKVMDLIDRLKEKNSDVGIGYEEVLNFIKTEAALAETGAKIAVSDLAKGNYKQMDIYLTQMKHMLMRIQELQEEISSEAKPESL